MSVGAYRTVAYDPLSGAEIRQTVEGTSTWFLDEITRMQFDYRLDTNPPWAARAYALVATTWFDLLLASHDAKMT